MKYVFTLLDTRNGGNIIESTDNFDYESEELMIFNWLEGNYSCDCNRATLLLNEDMECSEETNTLQLIQITDEKERIVYRIDS